MLGELPRELAEDRFWEKLPPPLLSMIVLGLAFLFTGLLGAAGSDGTADSKAFVRGVPWNVWLAVTGAAMALFVVLTVQAVRVLQHPYRWGFYPPRRRILGYLVCAIAGCLIACVYRLQLSGALPDLPVRELDFRTLVPFIASLIATAPWLTIVWLAHSECRELPIREDRPPGGQHVNDYADALEDRSDNPALFPPAIRRLERLWQLLLVCVGAFTIGVVAAVASAGALRGAFVAAHPDRADEFPPANVLLYGATFAVGLAVIGVPLAVAWRNRAQQLAERICPMPPDARPTAEWLEERKRIEHLLHLDIGVLRNPLTIFSVLAPLAVSAIAAFLPQLAN
ncbi:hypothetical protein GCM10009745_00170 [Kribbella yunnanensis]|uniref:Uncharacterized protein n=1 Tax=Kribbella yunnanensis TaxID=190194 RepID=A0ABP4RWD3_9ACTN